MKYYLIFLLNFNSIFTEIRDYNINYLTPSNCTENQFYNRLEFKCEVCPNATQPSADRLSCACAIGSINCSSCPMGTREIFGKCFQCPNSGNCQCSDDEIFVHQYMDGSPMPNAHCSKCAHGYSKLNDFQCVKCELDCDCNQNCTLNEDVNTNIIVQNGVEVHSKFIASGISNAIAMCSNRSQIHCEQLVNYCVLQNYAFTEFTACSYLSHIKRLFNPWQFSIDPTRLSDYNELDKENAIDRQFTFEDTSIIEIIFARFDLNGSFDGFFDMHDVNLNLCGPANRPKQFYRFGRTLKQQCFLQKPSESLHSNKFYEPYLKYKNKLQQTKIYPIFVLNSAIRVNNQIVNFLNNERSRWILSRRFYLVDDYSMSRSRYASTITLVIELQKDSDGFIYPPLLAIEYDDSEDDMLKSSFEIRYVKDPSDYDQKIVILLSVFIPLSLFWSAICSYSWGRRMGKSSAIDASSILYFLIREISVLGDVFFIFFSFIIIWVTFAYKSQTFAMYNILSDDQQQSIFNYFMIAAILKFISLVFKMSSLIFQETFFVDWERPRLRQINETIQPQSRDLVKSTQQEPIVVWRTYLIANEWNELHQYRKTSLSFQMLSIIIIHEYLNFCNYAVVEPGFSTVIMDVETSQTALMTKLAVVAFIYLFVLMCQWLVQVIVVERIVVDPFHNFIDLCSISNISVFSFIHNLHGYYIHGRSVHGKGDAGMGEMNLFLQRERDNLCGFRGLESDSELQTFSVNIPLALRQKYDEIHSIARQNFGAGADSVTAKMNSIVDAHYQLNNLLKSFIDHSINEIDYIVNDKKLIEAVFDCELTDTSKVASFVRDPSEIGYSECFVYGNEWSWSSFECLTTCVLFIVLNSLPFACFVTFIVSNSMRLIFAQLSTQHLIKTSLIDQRFLV